MFLAGLSVDISQHVASVAERHGCNFVKDTSPDTDDIVVTLVMSEPAQPRSVTLLAWC